MIKKIKDELDSEHFHKVPSVNKPTIKTQEKFWFLMRLYYKVLLSLDDQLKIKSCDR